MKQKYVTTPSASNFASRPLIDADFLADYHSLTITASAFNFPFQTACWEPPALPAHEGLGRNKAVGHQIVNIHC